MTQSHALPADEQGPQRQGGFRQSWRRWVGIPGVLVVGALVVGAVLLARHWPFSRQRVISDLQDDFHEQLPSTVSAPLYFRIRAALWRALNWCGQVVPRVPPRLPLRRKLLFALITWIFCCGQGTYRILRCKACRFTFLPAGQWRRHRGTKSLRRLGLEKSLLITPYWRSRGKLPSRCDTRSTR